MAALMGGTMQVPLTRDEHTREEGWLGRLRQASR